MLTGIVERLDKMEHHAHKHIATPPGLGCNDVSDILHALNDSLQVIDSSGLVRRLERLETLAVCSPSADAVLEGMLASSAAKQPEPEQSPVKPESDNAGKGGEVFGPKSDDDVSKCIEFAIYEDRVDAETQTVNAEGSTSQSLSSAAAHEDVEKEDDFRKRINEVVLAGDWEPMATSTREPVMPAVVRVGKTFVPFCFDEKVPVQVPAGSHGVMSDMGADYSMYVFFPDLADKHHRNPWRWVHRVHSTSFEVGWPANAQEVFARDVELAAAKTHNSRTSNRKQRQLSRRAAKIMM